MTVTPSLLASLLDTHAIGADQPGGSGTIKDQSPDQDHSEVWISGVYDLSEVAREVSDLDLSPGPPVILYGIVSLLLILLTFETIVLLR
jgi:hypothetical protein